MIYAAVKENLGRQHTGAPTKLGGVHFETMFMSAVPPFHITWCYLSLP